MLSIVYFQICLKQFVVQLGWQKVENPYDYELPSPFGVLVSVICQFNALNISYTIFFINFRDKLLKATQRNII